MDANVDTFQFRASLSFSKTNHHVPRSIGHIDLGRHALETQKQSVTGVGFVALKSGWVCVLFHYGSFLNRCQSVLRHEKRQPVQHSTRQQGLCQRVIGCSQDARWGHVTPFITCFINATNETCLRLLASPLVKIRQLYANFN